ncbi:MAG: hypothetical protein DMD35_10420 [Gemmatimonadetes bacterium]|nr:MAG: hypothetical protein DMD35_10420 [Gemmatimonadota bacterium]
MLTVSACSDSPIAPAAPMATPDAPDLGLFTWLLLPRGAQWALYFNSSSGDGSMNVKVIHYPTTAGTQDPVGTIASPNKVTGSGSFSLPGPKLSGTLQPTSFVGDGKCVPWGTPCDPAADGYTPFPVIIPEEGTVTGGAVVNAKATKFLLILKSTGYPDRSSDPDKATLRFCSAPDPANPTACGTAAYNFAGELHHEPT